MRRIRTSVFFAALAALVFAGGVCIGKLTRPSGVPSVAPASVEPPQNVREGGYRFINPLLDCDAASGTIDSLYFTNKNRVQKLIDQKVAEKNINSASVYFRDLNNGPWFGIAENEEFLPASLLKVPIAMEFYKLNETYPFVLATNIPFTKTQDLSSLVQTILPTQEISVGKNYTVEELINASLKYSDNQATSLLLTEVPRRLAEKGIAGDQATDAFTDARYLESLLGEKKDELSVRNYATFFRLLFNASFLERADSEKLLSTLSEAEYRDALVAGVPNGVVVSHKFGESGTDGGERQLHDCGIVYYPNRPYILCVMTRGTKMDALTAAIRDISRVVYEQIDAQK